MLLPLAYLLWPRSWVLLYLCPWHPCHWRNHNSRAHNSLQVLKSCVAHHWHTCNSPAHVSRHLHIAHLDSLAHGSCLTLKRRRHLSLSRSWRLCLRLVGRSKETILPRRWIFVCFVFCGVVLKSYSWPHDSNHFVIYSFHFYINFCLPPRSI